MNSNQDPERQRSIRRLGAGVFCMFGIMMLVLCALASRT